MSAPGDRQGPSASPASATLAALRDQVPLVQNITNFVAMDLAANVLLAVGASPAMVHAADEVEDFLVHARALTVNIGTLSPDWVKSMMRAADVAARSGKPWVLDPVGVGATPYRNRVAAELARLGPTVIRGNASEIMALAGAAAGGRGVDSTAGSDEALEAAQRLARATGAVVAVTGETDYVTDGATLLALRNGDALMTRVTAVGCALTALVGACCAVEPRPLVAAWHGLAILAVAGEQAGEETRAPGSFRVALLDALYLLDGAGLDRRVQLSEGQAS